LDIYILILYICIILHVVATVLGV